MEAIQIPGFEVLDVLFEDPLSTYYKAKHLKLNNYVWLRLLPVSKKKADVLLFQKQAESQSKINHPSVLSILDLWKTSHFYCQSYHYFDGESIYLRFKRTKTVFSEKEAISVLKKLAELFEYTEKKNLVHRSLCPRNIFIGEEGIKVHEFGFVEDPTECFYQNNSPVTPFYISPEQANGVEISNLNVQSDIYSAGIILFHMVAGRPPFQGTKLEIMSAHLKTELPWAQELNPELSRGLCLLLQKMTAKDIAIRLTPQEFSQAVQQLENQGDRPAVISSRPKREPSKSPAIKGASAIRRPSQTGEELPKSEYFRKQRARRKQQEWLLTFVVTLIVLGASYYLYQTHFNTSLNTNHFSEDPQNSAHKQEGKESEEAARLLDFANQFIKTHPLPNDHTQGIALLNQVIEKFPTTTQAQVAQTLLEAKKQDFELQAQKQFLKIKATAQKLFEEGNFAEAENTYLQFPTEFSNSFWAEQSLKNHALVSQQAKTQVQKWMYQGRDCLEEGDFQQAVQIFGQIIRSGYPEYQEEAQKNLQKAKQSLKKLSDD